MSTCQIIDTPWNTTDQVDCLKAAGITTVIRYYNNGNSSALPEKRLELDEAQALSSGGLKIAVVFQTSQDEASDFSYDQGYSAGTSAYNWASGTIGQPFNSAIYFAVDYNASQDDVDNLIIPYFNGVKAAFSDLGNRRSQYKIGAYGSGLVVNTLKDGGQCDYRWLSASTSYNGTQDALDTGEYEMVQIYPSDKVCNISLDYDQLQSADTAIGSFILG